jgi:hypothetical protein
LDEAPFSMIDFYREAGKQEKTGRFFFFFREKFINSWLLFIW